jgi:hydrogenase maturation protein HypF
MVARLAEKYALKGWVSNGMDGVHVVLNADNQIFNLFYQDLQANFPTNAQVTHCDYQLIENTDYPDFNIRESLEIGKPNLLISPDFGMCENCQTELFDPQNRRYHYPFITCTNCGPRYSIMQALPYDRAKTTMEKFVMCEACQSEYTDYQDIRYFSQTNSCAVCGVKLNESLPLAPSEGGGIISPLSFGEGSGVRLTPPPSEGVGGRLEGILAVKGIGGYLLMTDATNPLTINTLRTRKHRPTKPFAVLYPDLETLAKDVYLNQKEIEALKSPVSPIVLCRLREKPDSGICPDLIAPNLDKIGVMLPYTPLFALLSKTYGKPLIATSANLSGSPIIYQDQEAQENLREIADLIIANDREIVIPQDDSVLQFSPKYQQKIILRRSRGLAPTYLPNPFVNNSQNILAMGGELKSTIAFLAEQNLYISQYLGEQGSWETQNAYQKTYIHLQNLLQFKADKILIDAHPAYFSSQYGRELAENQGIPIQTVQHHIAHFCAVMMESLPLAPSEGGGMITPPPSEGARGRLKEGLLGIIWDGVGWGEDGQIWGGEFLVWNGQKFSRPLHWQYFDWFLGDKMAKEPRLSAISLLKTILSTANNQLTQAIELDKVLEELKKQFSPQEWNFYQNLLKTENARQTSSMGRFFDGVASLLGLAGKNSYEGESAMYLETLASTWQKPIKTHYSIQIIDNQVVWLDLLQGIIQDLGNDVPKAYIAYKFHYSLAIAIKKVANHLKIKDLYFSGGVFQNALLVDLIIEHLQNEFRLHFHQQLSPNDECISFGQIAYEYLTRPAQSPSDYHLQEKEINITT